MLEIVKTACRKFLNFQICRIVFFSKIIFYDNQKNKHIFPFYWNDMQAGNGREVAGKSLKSTKNRREVGGKSLKSAKNGEVGGKSLKSAKNGGK